MKYQMLSRPALHRIPDLELRADRDRLENAVASNYREAEANKKELAIINNEIKRRPLIPEDVFK